MTDQPQLSSHYGVKKRTHDFLRQAKRLIYAVPQLFSYYWYDCMDFISHSGATAHPSEREARLSSITVYAHTIEKGLSLPQPRPGFGERNIALLLAAVRDYLDRFGSDDTLARVQGVLQAYIEFNISVGKLDYPYKKSIDELLGQLSGAARGGVKTVTRKDLLGSVSGVSSDFFQSRSSVRIFSQEPVALEKIETALRVAQKSPSVCNRQSGFVHVLAKREDIAAALELQGGAKGFSDNVPMLLVITTRTRNFFGPERNQRWVDGGLFAMSLILGLHMQGLGTCSLNWSKPPKADVALKKLVGIASDRSIIFLLAVGEVPEEYRVAKSEKRPLSEMYSVA